MKRFASSYAALATLTCGCLISVTVAAEEFGGVEFPQGEASFADKVVSFEFNDATGVQPPYDDGERVLGIPDYETADSYISLGNTPADGVQSELIVEFVDNRLIDVDGDDLYIFEIGPQVESTEVAVSEDGELWYDLGAIEGSTRGVDLANYDEIPDGTLFRFVRLRDTIDGSTSGSPYAGPDIDAIGAIGADVSDGDGDGVHDSGDNCVDVENPDQQDGDEDLVGDACDTCPDVPGLQADGCPADAGATDDGAADDEVANDDAASDDDAADEYDGGAGDEASDADDEGDDDDDAPDSDAGADDEAADDDSDSDDGDSDDDDDGDSDDDDDGDSSSVSCSCRTVGHSTSGSPLGQLFALMAMAAAVVLRRR